MIARNDTIRVLTGTFSDFAGRVTVVEGDRAVADVKVFGRPTPVELTMADVELHHEPGEPTLLTDPPATAERTPSLLASLRAAHL